jgi:serine/threonine-protein kinase
MRVGPATDVYALGCVLYEMLVGEPPYTGSTPQAILVKIIAGDGVSAIKQRASVPANVDAAILKALEKVPADRFGSAEDFAGALADRNFRHGGPAAGSTSPPSAWQAAAFLGVGGLLGVAAMALWLGRDPTFGGGSFSSAQPVTRFVIAPPATAPLADQGSLDLAISPDGRRIAYLVRKLDSGRIEIFVRDLEALEPGRFPARKRRTSASGTRSSHRTDSRSDMPLPAEVWSVWRSTADRRSGSPMGLTRFSAPGGPTTTPSSTRPRCGYSAFPPRAAVRPVS